MEKIVLKGTRFLTESGKEVIFNGINVLSRGRENGHLPVDFESSVLWFRKMGFNLLRYGITWDAVEPEPGVIDEDYLAKVKKNVRIAEDAGIYILFDMHQDLFAQKFGNGAPDWACLDDGLPFDKGHALWYEAYLSSEPVIRAADAFWANKPAEDGVGLLDHYEKMWERIGEVFADCDNVIAFEPMNEPFMGSTARMAFGEALVRIQAKNPNFSLYDSTNADPEETAEFMGIVAEKLMDFDRTTLMDFYRRMQKAMQKHCDKPIATGGNIYNSTDLPTGIEALPGGHIYAPHGYDAVVDSDNYSAYNKDSVARLYAHKREAQERLGLPTIAAEWGAFPSKPFTNDLIRFMYGIVEQNLWGSCYCEYHRDKENDPNFTALCRSYPQETAGRLHSLHSQENCFEMRYEAKAGGVTRIFLNFIPEKAEAENASWRVTEQSDGCCTVELTAETEGLRTIRFLGA